MCAQALDGFVGLALQRLDLPLGGVGGGLFDDGFEEAHAFQVVFLALHVEAHDELSRFLHGVL